MLLFGPLRERVGVAELAGHGTTVREVWSNLARDRGLDDAVTYGIRAVRNLTYCDWDTHVEGGDVIAFLPPVAGGSTDVSDRVRVLLAGSPIDVGAVIADVGSGADGAVAVFIGRVRDHNDGHAVERIDYEAYTPMAEREMRAIADQVCESCGASAISIAHRTGTLEVGDASVVIAVAAPHRAEALRACQLAIDMIKETVPIWKREHRDDGARWVDARHGADGNSVA